VVALESVTDIVCAPVGTPDPRNHASVRVASVVESVAKPTRVSPTPPYDTLESLAVAAVSFWANKMTPASDDVTGLCTQVNGVVVAVRYLTDPVSYLTVMR